MASLSGAVETGPGPESPPNLTRDDAARRAGTVTVQSYEVALDLTDGQGRPGEKTFDTRSVVHFTATSGAATWIDFVGDGIRSAELNGEQLDVAAWTCRDGLALPGLQAENVLVVEAVGLYTNTGEGLHRFADPEDGAVYLYSQFETADAKRMFACFDQPDLKATFRFRVVAPAGWRVVTNAAAESVRGPGGDPAPEDVAAGPDGVADGGPWTHLFGTTPRMSTYVTALVAGPYHVVRSDHDGIELGLYCRRPLAPYLDAERLFTETAQGFDFFHDAFGVRYPFGKYDQLFVPEFNAGAMENAGAVTFREEYVFRSKVTGYLYERRCETVLHEMAHMWFGDLVTMRWWDDLWLNESFATWASVVAQVGATRYTGAWTTFANVEKSWAYVQDQLPSTHPIAADMVDLHTVELNFDGITYAKGASVLKQLAAYVGYESFLAGLREYFRSHAFGNARLTDLLAALEQASGRDLSAWSAAWLQTTGLNTVQLDVETAPDDAGVEVITRIEVLQSPAEPGAGELRPHRLAVGIYDDDGSGRLVRTHRTELDVTGARTAVPDLVGARRGALLLVNDDDLTYCKLRLDAASLGTAIERIGDIADSLPRTLVWSSIWEMTRDGRNRARDFVRTALAGLPRETEIGVVQRILAQTQLAISSYAEPGWATSTGWPQFTGTVLRLVREEEPGSDRQLALVNALAAARLHPDEVAVLAGWRDGTDPLPGLEVDTDLSWTLLGALVAHGAAGTDDIDRAAAADPTASGQRRAAAVRALLPDADAKAALWDRLMHDDGMANALQDASIGGFAHPAQGELLAPFVRRYFDTVGEVWHRRSPEVAQKVVVGLYPRWAVSPEAVELATSWESGDHPVQLARLISEGRAGVQRAVRARAADAGGADAG
ncbi:aminopeptidase N [Nakamurella endophytica]|uniref:Aminopeptidase N n=1 Tax=Nakamurella endophytica TaxID=1748367 RepID=A0A917WHJ4_9ACTN|nr:aminopeptidase N [Nakamurella endophytica]GGM06906.1 aminopeptidase N [Nakamurella endophytica]